MNIIHYHFECIDSTNTWAKEHVEKLDPLSLTLITVDTQTGGRGRFKRKWHSPPHVNIYATFCFFLEKVHFDKTSIGQIPQLLALSTAYCLESLDFKPTLKWPNDVLLSGKKVAGILCETISDPMRKGRWVICGIGLNVRMSKNELDLIDRPATSLLVEAKEGNAPDLKLVLDLIQKQFNCHLIRFLKDGFQPFFSDYKKRSHFKKGQSIRFHDNQNMVEGFFHGLNKDGSLTLDLNQNAADKTEIDSLKTYYAGEFL